MVEQIRSIGRVLNLNVEQCACPTARCGLRDRAPSGGATIVALDDQGRACLLRQFRHAAGWLLELPAGKSMAATQQVAVRELAEEAGTSAARDPGIDLQLTGRLHGSYPPVWRAIESGGRDTEITKSSVNGGPRAGSREAMTGRSGREDIIGLVWAAARLSTVVS
jgi:hypothetical protein